MSSGGERSTDDWRCQKCGRALGWCEPTICDKCLQTTNNVHSKDFESKIDDYFTSKTKEKESGRKCSIKIFGQWT